MSYLAEDDYHQGRFLVWRGQRQILIFYERADVNFNFRIIQPSTNMTWVWSTNPCVYAKQARFWGFGSPHNVHNRLEGFFASTRYDRFACLLCLTQASGASNGFIPTNTKTRHNQHNTRHKVLGIVDCRPTFKLFLPIAFGGRRATFRHFHTGARLDVLKSRNTVARSLDIVIISTTAGKSWWPERLCTVS